MSLSLVGAIGFLLLAAVATFFVVRSMRKSFQADLEAFAMTVPAPLTDDARRWLTPQFYRHTLYPTLGLIWGTAAVQAVPVLSRDVAPWYWFSTFVGVTTGALVGELGALLRTTSPPLSTVRAADPFNRRVSASFMRPGRLALRLAPLVSALTVVWTVVLTATSDVKTSGAALLVAVVCLALALAHRAVTAAALRRPLSASSVEGLVWQKALLDRSMRGAPWGAAFGALYGVGTAAYVTVVDWSDATGLTIALGTFTVAAAAASAVVVLRAHRRDRNHPRASPAEFIGGRATP